MKRKNWKKLRERLSALEHVQWMVWSQAIASYVPISKRLGWEKLWIPYSDLSEINKDKDRVWADLVIDELKDFLND